MSIANGDESTTQQNTNSEKLATIFEKEPIDNGNIILGPYIRYIPHNQQQNPYGTSTKPWVTPSNHKYRREKYT